MFVRAGAVLIAAGMGLAASGVAPGQTQGTPGKFDFYLLDLAAGTDFCHVPGIGGKCDPPQKFVLHGLWPQNDDGTYPVNCRERRGLEHPEMMLDVTPNLTLVEHEWEKHGTCTKLSPRSYFAAGRKAYERIRVPAGLSGASVSGVMAQDDLLEMWRKANPKLPPGSVVLGCNAQKELTQVGVCLSKRLKPIACRNVHLCREEGPLTFVPPLASGGS